MVITIDGLNSGLDTDSIVQGLLEIQQTQLDRLELRKQEIIQEQTAFQTLETHIISFRSSASRLSRIHDNVFEARSVSVSDENSLIAVADSDAVVGSYQLTVNSLAQAHQVASQGFADKDSEITQGTFSIRLGSRPAVDITVDNTNDTLQGLADSINLAQTGVSASIIKDSSLGASPYRLLLTSSETGADNAIVVDNNLAASSGGAVQPQLDFANPVQAAANAQVTLGSGPGAIVVEDSDNQVDDVITGISLSLLQADAGKQVSVRVANDTTAAVEAVQDLVDGYNSLRKFVEDQTRYIPETDDAGLLLGNRALQTIESRVQSALQNVVPGLNSQSNRLSTIGVSVTETGRLTFNSSKLESILTGQEAGISAANVRSLFALDGSSSSQGVKFILGSTRTIGSENPIEVDITQAAERAQIQATNTLAASTVIGASNNRLDLTLDGADITVTLTSGTYTNSELAAELESVINAHPDVLGRVVSVGLQDDGGGSNHLTIRSESYGQGSQVTIRSGNAMADLGFTGVENEVGKDVKGTFTVDGVVEEATGSGRLLAGKFGNQYTADLQVEVTLLASELGAGAEAQLTLSRGVAARLDQEIGQMLDSQSGIFKTTGDRYSTDVENIEDSIDRQREIFEQQEAELLEEFVALEQALGQLQSTSSFLSTQLANLPTLNKKSK